ncbi:hypothetical protein [Actinoplanes subglobosus]|uniref:HNH endonuclease n=1 Tax=Actinoplanes subglobosus TaxID=1547892 RepID=A0ABV8IUR6_9ACTN
MTDETDARGSISAAAQAALWVLSNGRCYYPRCTEPVVKLARLNVYRKNVQIAHIHGVKPESARYKKMPAAERDGFGNLMLMCTPHHAEIDNKRDGETRYPAELLRKWKKEHEGRHGVALEKLGQLDLDRLGDALAEVFVPPVDRLNAIADQLERTGIDNKRAVAQLRQIAAALSDVPPGADATTARRLAYAAEVFATVSLGSTARLLAESAEYYSHSDLAATANRLLEAAQMSRYS